jgi:hypothetical protein
MRKPIYDPPFLTDPDFAQWLKSVERETNEIVQAIKLNKTLPPLKDHIWQSFKKRFLLSVNKGRCVYCEGKYLAGAFADAEHYAPKGKITDNRIAVQHPGYYWLAYDWRNLLLSCKKCNSSHPDLDNNCSHPGKLNEFPVKKTRVQSPGSDPTKWWENLLAEGPYLFHPYYDDPRKHFEARRRGYLRGKTKKGKITIEVCHLNRPEVREARADAEELADGRAMKLLIAIAGNQQVQLERFGMADAFSTYLNCILEERLREKANKIMAEAAR